MSYQEIWELMIIILLLAVFSFQGFFVLFFLFFFFVVFLESWNLGLILSIGIAGHTEIQVFSLPYEYTFSVAKFTKGENCHMVSLSSSRPSPSWGKGKGHPWNRTAALSLFLKHLARFLKGYTSFNFEPTVILQNCSYLYAI